MHFKFGFLSLFLVMPLVMANPVAVHTCGKDLQSQASQSQAPIHLPDMDVGQVARPANGKVQWVRCSGRTKKCIAKVVGRRYRAVWRLRSFRRGRFDGDEDDSELFNGKSGRLILKSIKCDAAARPQVCTGRVQRTRHIATWVAKIPRPYFNATDAAPTEETLIDELEEMTAEGDFADDDVFGEDELLEEDGEDTEDADFDLSEGGNDGLDEDDEGLLQEGDEDGDDLLQDEESALAPVRVRSLTCNRRTRICKAALLSKGLVAKWNVRIRRSRW
jgi:hypothetical protein